MIPLSIEECLDLQDYSIMMCYIRKMLLHVYSSMYLFFAQVPFLQNQKSLLTTQLHTSVRPIKCLCHTSVRPIRYFLVSYVS